MAHIFLYLGQHYLGIHISVGRGFQPCTYKQYVIVIFDSWMFFSAYPGSVHDSRVFKNSPLFKELERNPLPEKYHLLGDSAYSLTTFLLTPFRNNGQLKAEEKQYNYAHSSTRVAIERCFGLLKGKFRKLKYLDMQKTEDMPRMIITCCALHNFVLLHESLVENDIDTDEVSIPEDMNTSLQEENHASTSGQEKRQQIMHLLN